jgi:sigma-B regulation protein RsbU (phosphoserine phosphatase)
LDPGDTLLLFTDGLTEASNALGEVYADRVKRAAGAVASLHPEDQVSQVINDNASFRGEVAHADDLTVLAIQRARQTDPSGDSRSRQLD